MKPPPPSSTLFPYTTLFRSKLGHDDRLPWADNRLPWASVRLRMFDQVVDEAASATPFLHAQPERGVELDTTRSEEHTSELQSHVNLVCRLLLEKKKKKIKKNYL